MQDVVSEFMRNNTQSYDLITAKRIMS